MEKLSISIPQITRSYEETIHSAAMNALEATNGNKQEAAKLLEIKRTTLVQWLIRHEPHWINYRFNKKTNRKTGGRKKK